MSKLIKDFAEQITPGTPGGYSTLGSDGYWTFEPDAPCSGASNVQTTIIQHPDGQISILQSWEPCGTTETVQSTEYGGTVARDAPVTGSFIAETDASSKIYIAPTAAQITYSLNEGWNTYARVIRRIYAGTYLEFTIKLGTAGALVALGPEGYEGQSIGKFSHGLMVDVSGIHVFEAGVKVATIATNQPTTFIRLFRQADGRVAYATRDSNPYISTAPAIHPEAPLYVYGMLYAGGDEVSSAEFAEAAVSLPDTVTLSGAGSLTARGEPSVAMAGVGALISSVGVSVTMAGTGLLEGLAVIEHRPEATLQGAGSLSAFAVVGGRGLASLPAFTVMAGDHEFAQGLGVLPLFVSGVTNGQSVYIPPDPTRGYVNLPFWVGAAHGIDIDHGDGAASMPVFVGLGGDYAYGFGSASLPKYFGIAAAGFIADDEMILVGATVATSRYEAVIDLVLILNSSGQITSSFSLTREQVLELLSQLDATDSLSLLGVYGASMLSNLRGLSLQTTSLGGAPDLSGNGVVWVVNAETNASSQYEGYGFNSFFTRAGVAYGVAADGVYRLEGETDAGAQIDALANIGKLDMSTALQKMLPSVYLGASSTAPLKLEVDADGTVYTYETRSNEDGTFKQHRVDLGLGLKANMLGLTLKNKDGADFEIASVDLLTAAGTRRI